MGHWRVCRLGIPYGLWVGGSLDRVHDDVNRIVAICWVGNSLCSKSSPFFPDPRLSQLLSLLISSVFWARQKKKVVLLGGILHSRRCQVFTFPMGEVTGQVGLYHHWAMLPWGRGKIGKVKLFLLSSIYLFLDFCSKWYAETSPLNFWIPTKLL